MKIAFEAKRAFLNNRGPGNYARGVLNSLVTYYPNNEYILFTPQITEMLDVKNFKVIAPKLMPLKSFWKNYYQGRVVNKLMPDIYHGLFSEIPPGINDRIKKVVTIHDLISIKFPQFYKYFDRMIYRKKIKRALKVADKIVAITNQTKHDIVHHFAVDSEKIEVIYQSVNPIFYNDSITIGNHDYNLPSSYLLYVGAIEPNKNLKSLILALSGIDIALVVIGRQSSYQIELEKLAKKIKLVSFFLNDVNFFDLPSIYRNASCFVFPSFYEGFGTPVAEALFSKVPVIASDIGAFHESAGSSSIFFNPVNIDELKHKIEMVLGDEDLRKDMIQKGWQHVQQFKVENVVQTLHEFYLRLNRQ